MESDSNLRHLAFFEALANTDENDPNWRALSAGLVVMRLVDDWIRAGYGPISSDSWNVVSVRESIAQIETIPLRRILSAIVDTIVASPIFDVHALNPRLMAYGQSLEYDAKWSLAADVYETVVSHADPAEDADLVASAYIQLAFCRRTLTQLDEAAIAYERASEVALTAGDMIGVLRARLGDAKIAMARGNMPHAEVILDDTIARAEAGGLVAVQSRALIDRAYLAGVCQQYDRVVRYSYAALELSPTARDRDRILTNIATGFRFLGLLDTARDAYLVLAATAQEQYIRWMSELNLMELAAQQQQELQFDKYRRDLEASDFSPELRVIYLLHVGRGYHALGRADQGVPYLERAIETAAKHQLNQMLFEAEAALTDARRRETQVIPAPAYSVELEVKNVIDAVQQMKVMAGV